MLSSFRVYYRCCDRPRSFLGLIFSSSDVPTEQAPYNLCAAAEEEQQVFGSERPGFVR